MHLHFSIVDADIAAATVLISMGAVLGKTTYMQLVVMGIIEITILTCNSYIGHRVLKVGNKCFYFAVYLLFYVAVLLQVTDVGGSIFVHTFGAYFGLGVSSILSRRSQEDIFDKSLQQSSYTSDLFAMIGNDVCFW